MDGGFHMVLGLSDIFLVEPRALLEGLKLAWAKGYRQVEIKSDNAILISVVQNGIVMSNIYNEVRLIHDWYFKNWNVTFR